MGLRDFEYTLLDDNIDETEAYEFLREFSIQSSSHNDRALKNSYALGKDLNGEIYGIERNSLLEEDDEAVFIYKEETNFREEII